MGLNKELDGLLIISLDQAVAAPYCSLLLADSGARVIKVERPEGDFARGYDSGANGKSSIFAWLNKGKESICLNLDEINDTNLLFKMLENADVLLSNLAPGSLEKRGFAGHKLREKNKKLITCSITGYGDSEDAAKMKAYDFLVQAESGLCSVTGNEQGPTRVGVSITDLSTGLTAFSGILRALHQRNTTGVGIDLKISMFDVIADWMNMPLLAHRYMDGAPKRVGLKHSFIAPYGAYKTKDKKEILISIQNNREWKMFCNNVIGKPEFVEDIKFKNNTDRYENREILDNFIENIFSNLEKNILIEKLKSSKIAYANLNDVSDLSKHQFLRNQKAFYGDAEIEMADLPLKVEGERPKKVPLLNENNLKIREEFV